MPLEMGRGMGVYRKSRVGSRISSQKGAFFYENHGQCARHRCVMAILVMMTRGLSASMIRIGNNHDFTALSASIWS
jgi:hypothetical protein